MSHGGLDEPPEPDAKGRPAGDEVNLSSTAQPTELLTFLFADIRGYTRFTQQRGDEAAGKLTAKFAGIVRELVAQFDGTVLELRGDEALCLFRSPRQSLRLAVALQQRFVTETAGDAELPMTVGIGVDAGEAVRSDDGYRGGALNLAARLCSQAKAGEVLATSEVTHLARTIDGIRYTSLDSVALKGLSDPVRPVRVCPVGEDPAQQIAALVSASGPPAPTPPGSRRLPRAIASRPRLAAAIAVLVAAIVIGAVVVAVRPDHATRPLKAVGENSIGQIDPHNGHITGTLGLAAGASAATSGYDSVWTADSDANTVSRIDPRTNHVISTVDVGAGPSAIVTGLGSVWVTNSGSGTVTRIDPTTNDKQTITVGAAPGGITVAGRSVWVANTADGTVSRIDPAKNAVAETLEVGANPTGISAGRDIWVANSGSNTVSKIDGVSHAVTQIHVGNDPTDIVVVGDSVWVTNNLDGTVMRIDTTGTSVTGAVGVGSEPAHLLSAYGRLWIATRAAEGIAEIDPASTRLVRTVHVGATPGSLAAAIGKLWITTSIDPALHRGGTIRIDAADTDPPDPVYAQNVGTFWLLNSSYDGLVGYRHASGADGTAVVPDLAVALPDPTDGGRTYAFQLRSGIRWSTGAPLTVFDVRRGIERIVASGFSTLGQEIVGSVGCKPSRCNLTGVAVAPSTQSVTITLVRPDGGFLNKLANFGAAVPAATPLGPLTTRPIPATGPYQVSRYVPGKLVLLTRNRFFRQWSAAAQPAGFPDSIQWTIEKAVDPKAATAATAAGRSDWADARDAGTIGALQAQFGDRSHVTPTETTHGVALNTRIAPFNDARVRRALAFAIDRDAVAADWFTPAAVTCQVLPPDFPGHRPYCPYTLRPDATQTWKAPDFVTAQRLVDQSHTRGMSVTVYATANTAAGTAHVVTALRGLGYRARLVQYSDAKFDYFSFVDDSRNKVQAAFYGWVASDVSPGDFFSPIFECKGFTPASPANINVSGFCDRSTDSLIGRAEQAESSSPATANDLWAGVDQHIVDASPWIPLVTPTWVDVVSTRVHNYVRSPVLGVFFGQMWVH